MDGLGWDMVGMPTGTVTLLFTDIEGSTRRWEALPEAMTAALARHDDLLFFAIEANGGHVFKTVGDAFCAAFADAGDALRACLVAQRSLAATDWGAVGHVRVRMALHTGNPEHRDADYFGPPVNRVARLLSTGYGGQVLVSAATAEQLSARLPAEVTLADLGAHRLKDLLQPERIFQVAAPGLEAEFPPLKSLDRQPHNLPAQPTPLVGREAEVAAARALVEDGTRLVTLTGPGGTGKTRLGLQVAAELVDSVRDGAWFVGLAPLTDAGLVVGAIAAALGVRETGHEPLEATLLEYLAAKELLLLLDNFEHVVAAAPLVGRLLAGCPKVRLLVTSRAALRVYGEREVPVPPLALPDLKRLPPLQELGEVASVELFVERAQAVKPGFALSAENAAAVAGICVRLEGLPLAIELAAARARILPPTQLLERLSSRLGLLTGGAADRDARQQTLRGAIAWSHDLLAPAEQVLFRRLAAFAGGTFDAIEAVCAGDGAADALDGVESLVAKSLLRQAEHDDGPRFFMLEMIREFAGEQLATAGGGEAELTAMRHADYFLAFAEAAEPELKGAEQGDWLDRLETEHDNLRAALGYLVRTAKAELAQRLSGALVPFWELRGHLSEGRGWLERALAMDEATSVPVRAHAMGAAAGLALSQSDYAQAGARFEQALALYRQVNDRRGIARTLVDLGTVATGQGEHELAQGLYEESLPLLRELGDTHNVTVALNWLGSLAFLDGDFARATGFYEESLALARQLHGSDSIMSALVNLAEARQYQGDLERATALYHEALPLARALGIRGGIAFALYGLGKLAQSRGELTQARELLVESLGLSHELGDRSAIAGCLEGLAGVANAQGQPDRAARLFGAAEALRETIGAPLAAAYRPDYEREVAATRAALDASTIAAAWAAGRALPVEQAIADAASPGG